jgi:hypothetical protein
VRFLFTTLHYNEAEFYGRVGARLQALGHEVGHLSYSRRGARLAAQHRLRSWCLPDLLRDAGGEVDWEASGHAIARRYATPTLRDIYKTDRPCDGKPDSWCVERTVRHFKAIDGLFADFRPDVVVPEVGSEMMRTVTHLVGLDRGVQVLFLFDTIFPDPLRLYANTMHAPIVAGEDVRELSAEERAEVAGFIEGFTSKRKPIRPYRVARLALENLQLWLKLIRLYRGEDRDHEYLALAVGPQGTKARLRDFARSVAVRPLYRELDSSRPFVYFPLHVVDDYKIKRVIPHCYDQASLIEQVADSLPHGYDIVLKEHPMSIGRNSMALLRRLRRIPNAQLVEPHTSSHELMERAEAIIVISSTVGLEALMYGKPVLTMGQPFYGGFGVTVDVDSFREIREKVPQVLEFRPDRERILQFLHASMRRCFPGAPFLVDSSDENAEKLASSLHSAVTEGVPQAPSPIASTAA